MPKHRVTTVLLIADRPVYLEGGITLPVGRYQATMKEIATGAVTGSPWAAPLYYIDFSAEEFRQMGVSVDDDFSSVQYDVTRFVRNGDLRLA